ncbi:MAG: hypothetical protein JWO18_591 [Microbacteriaceae bacterium]|jgi:cell wall-associated NlpC family hydrolase|nr:hypothetical protein [Microbacteriaceae bacterium]
MRQLVASGGAMIVALGLAATMAIPAVSASASAGDVSSAVQQANYAALKHSQRLTVSSAVTTTSVIRDGSSVMYAAAVDGASVYGGSALPATPLSIGANMVISPPNLAGGGDAVVQYALQFVGMVPYIMGGNSPSTGFTCDTFVRYVYNAFGVHLTGNAVAEARQGTQISEADAVAGDLVYYPGQHIGIYDGKGGIVDAPKPGTDVSHRLIWGSPEFIRVVNR